MAGNNLDLTRRLIEAFATRDVETFEAYCDPQIEIQPAITRFEGTAFRGARAYRQFLEQIDEAWESLEGSLEQCSTLDDDRVMAISRLRTRSRGRGVPIDVQMVWIMTFREGKLARIDAYTSVAAALEAARQPRA